MAADEKRTIMARLFEQKMMPTSFLASFASASTTRASTIEIDIVRGLETYAVDIVPGAGSRSNKKTRYTTKEYAPPMYNESYSITAEELQKRLPGQTKYDAADSSYQATMAALISDKQALMQEKEIRAIELQARDAMFDGQITLHNGDVIDFKKKATHDITPGTKWDNASGTPIDDIQSACSLCRKDGKISASQFRLIVADEVVEALIANAQFTAKANLRHVENVNFSMPTDINADGAVFHGIFSAGPYKIELWSYPQFYTVPTGFGLANEGTQQPYVPAGRALLLPATGLRMDLWYGGVPVVVNQVEPRLAAMGLSGTIDTVETDFHPYARLDDRDECIECGVKTRPLFVPHQIDGLATFTAVLT